jgi:hypothetical protein
MCSVKVGMEDHPSTHILLTRGKRRVKEQLGFRAISRNPRARKKRVKKRGKVTRLIKILRYC